MPHDAMRHWKSTGTTCTFSEYLDLIAPAQEEYIRKCTDGLTASAAHWAVNHQESWPYDLRDFTLGVVSSWDLDDVMDSKVMKKCRKSAGRHRPRGVWDGASPAGIWKIRSSGKPGRRPASRQRSEDHDTKVPGQPLT